MVKDLHLYELKTKPEIILKKFRQANEQFGV